MWTLIGVFSATLFAMFAATSSYFVRSMNAGFARVDVKIDGLQGEMNAKIDGLRGEMKAKFEVVDVKFARLEDRLNHIDRDVQAISRRVFPDV